MWSCSICRNIVCQHATHQHNVTLLAAHSCNSQRFGLAIAAVLQCHKFVTVYAECVYRMWTRMCVLVCFSVSLCRKYLQSSKKTAPWIFFLSLSPCPWFLTLEHPGKFDFQGHSDVHTPQPQFPFFSLFSLLTKTQCSISSTTHLPGDGGLVFAPHM